MTHIKGIFLILGMLFLGEMISFYIDHLFPGSVIGMLLLFGALKTQLIKADDIRPVATFLTRNMALFFIPASVGIISSWDLISKHWIALTAITVLTTVIVISVVGLLQQKMGSSK